LENELKWSVCKQDSEKNWLKTAVCVGYQNSLGNRNIVRSQFEIHRKYLTDIEATPSDRGLKENRDKLRKFERHFSDKIIEKLNYEDLIKIKKRNLTIVFWDIENSSTLSDILMAADIAYPELVQSWYRTVSEIIFEFDGSIDKFMGDGTMAIFSIPNKDSEGKQDAINAVYASLKAREGFEQVRREWNEKWSKEFSRSFDIGLRCGINTGNVFYGNFGTPRNDQLTVMGSEVHIASRLESLKLEDESHRNRIIISRTTETRVRGEFNLIERGSVNLNKILGSFPIYEVLGKK
jgi:adenylate cyclase